MTAANPQKVLSLLNERLTPHGVKCRDMTLVVASGSGVEAMASNLSRVVDNVHAHPDRAAIVFNVSDALRRCLLLGGLTFHPNSPWIFLHRDNTYCPMAGTTLDKQLRNTVMLVTGTDETCAVCLEGFDIDKGDLEEIPCGHHFHRYCLHPLTNNNRPYTNWQCPLCRAPFEVSVQVV